MCIWKHCIYRITATRVYFVRRVITHSCVPAGELTYRVYAPEAAYLRVILTGGKIIEVELYVVIEFLALVFKPVFYYRTAFSFIYSKPERIIMLFLYQWPRRKANNYVIYVNASRTGRTNEAG